MTKTDFVKKIASKCNSSIADAEKIMHAFTAACMEALVQKKTLPITGFGIIKVQKRKERTGRNPRSGATLTIPACNVAKFSMSKVLREALNQ